MKVMIYFAGCVKRVEENDEIEKLINWTEVELEKWRDHYNAVASEKGKGKIGWFYVGKADVLVDMLKMFEPLEG